MSQGTPRFNEIADELRHKIKSGQLEPGDTLRVGELKERYWAARNTVTSSLRQLEGEGFLTRVGGKDGWRVLSPERGKEDPTVTAEFMCRKCGSAMLVMVNIR